MPLIESIEALSCGALFRRADLHIHSFGDGGSYDADATMTPQSIVDTAIKERLDVIAITDHNRAGNIRTAIKHAEGKKILVVPGVELSTSQGHLLVYFPTPDALERFCGKLRFSDDRKQCEHTIPQCLQIASEFDGFGICAHIEAETGVERACSKYDAFKQAIFNCENLLALEIINSGNSDWFTQSDADQNRRNCAAQRRKHLNYEDDVELAKVMSSDAHKLVTLGRNASGNKRLTRLKMETLSFDALRIALKDCAARVRLEELIPPSIPHFVGMRLEGGFLRDQIVHFSKNLTCIIGGRGAGKSTMLESLRVVSGNESENTLIDSEVWPDNIALLYQDEAGQRHIIRRSKLRRCINPNPDGPTWVSIESYGQGETAETIQHCDSDPSILLKFLDGFMDQEEIRQQDAELRDQLLENQTLIEALQRDIDRIAETEKLKSVAEGQVAMLKSQNASEVVELEERIARENLFRGKLRSNLAELLSGINSALTSADLRALATEYDGSTLAVGKDQFDAVKSVINGLAAQVDAVGAQLKESVTSANAQILAQLKVWFEKEKETRAKIEELRADLEKKNIRLDMAFIRKVTKDATDFAARLTELKKSAPKKQEADKKRRELLTARSDLMGKLFAMRHGFATSMNKNLEAAVVDYRVVIRFHEGLLSKEFEELLKSTMGWRTSQVPRASLIAGNVSPLTMLAAISASRRDTAFLEELTDDNGNRVFSKAEADAILTAMSGWVPRCALERCVFDDCPAISVTGNIKFPSGAVQPRTRDFSKLSLGQQQSILLSILLFSKSKAPLIIDQPEDNLDSEFIYKTLVRSLRNIKEHRQVIVVTHNANIAVLGDAELIVPLRGANDLAVIRDRGSIDTAETKEIVCAILEGGKRAFKRRQDVYGY